MRTAVVRTAAAVTADVVGRVGAAATVVRLHPPRSSFLRRAPTGSVRAAAARVWQWVCSRPSLRPSIPLPSSPAYGRGGVCGAAARLGEEVASGGKRLGQGGGGSEAR